MMQFDRTESHREKLKPRIRWAAILMIAVVAILAARLWHLQLIQGEAYVDMSRSNRMKLIRLTPSRGRILDAAGRVLADNSPGFTLGVVRGELSNPQAVIDTCAPIVGVPPERMRRLIDQSRSVARFLTYPIKKNVTLEEVSLIRAQTTDLKGVTLEVSPRRVHPFGQSLCHVLGTLGEISPEELSRSAQIGYRGGDLIGKSGLEKEYEPYLRGVDGWERIEIDAMGNQLGSRGRKPPEQGADLVLTTDVQLQQFVEDVFVHEAGSVVAVDPDTGRILALVSNPGFDLNLFSPAISQRQWKSLNSDPLNPLENRAIRGLYSPGSAFKIVTTSAALAERSIKPDQTFTCKGELELKGQSFRCWNPYGHGKIALRRAIIESCDIYFYELGLKLGGDVIARSASLFGLGKPTGLGLPDELPGLIPTSAWKLRTHAEPWKDGETVNLSIGKGYLVATPVQMAMMTAAIANGGKLLKPAIVQQIRAADGRIVFDHAPVLRWKVPLDDADLTFLRNAMLGVVSEGRGTGKMCRIRGIQVAGKTGTSQVIRQRQKLTDEAEMPYHERPHAIFVAFVDSMPKKIALVVVVEHGGSGGKVAAPIARKIICKYYGVPDPGDPEE